MNDVLMWWHEHSVMYPHLSHSVMYPHLSQMALDYLTIPGESCSFLLQGNFLMFIAAMSVDVECVFSCGQRCQDTDFSEKYELGLEEKSWKESPRVK